MYSLSQTAFFLFFFGLLFLLLIFGETTIGVPILGALVLLCACNVRSLRFEQLRKLLIPAGLMGGFCLVALASTLSTISVPFTVNAAMFYLAAFVVFIFFLCRDQDWLPNSMMLWGCSTLAVVFSILTVLYTLVPALSRFLPSATLLTAYYGHNQAALMFLLALPMLWQLAESRAGKFARLGIVIVLIGFVCSFARLALVLAAIELLILWTTTADKQLRKLGKLVSAGAMAIVILFATLSLVPTANTFACQLPYLHQQLCKPLHSEPRPAYWLQAISAWKERPLLGWGGGTFALTSSLFQKAEGQYSGYAHNEFLQMFSEYGVLGGSLFLAFGAWIIRKSVENFKQPAKRLPFCLALGISATMLESFFDFGWHMIGLWMFFLIVLSVWLVELKVEKKSSNQSFFALWKMLRLEFFAAAALVIFWAVAFLVSSYYWIVGKRDLALNIFPLTYWRVDEVLRSPESVSPITFQNVFFLYRNHSHSWDEAALAPRISEAQKAEYLHQALLLDPTTQNRYWQYLQTSYDAKDWVQFETAATLWVNKTNAGALPATSFQENSRLTDVLFDGANASMKTDPARSARLYQLSYAVQPERFLERDFSQWPQLVVLQASDVLPLLSTIQIENVWKHIPVLYELESTLLTRELAAGHAESAEQLTKNIFAFGDNEWTLAAFIDKNWQQELRKTSKANPVLPTPVLVSYAQAILTWESEMKRTSKEGRFAYDSRMKLVGQLHQAADLQQNDNPSLSALCLQLATQLDEHVSAKP